MKTLFSFFLFLIPLTLLLFSNASSAEDLSQKLASKSAEKVSEEIDANSDFFNDMSGVKKLLRVSGVDVTSVNWVEINSMCDALAHTSEKLRNQCRYEKALLQSTYITNKSFCKNLAKRIAKTQPNKNTNITATDNSGNQQNVNISETENLSRKQIREMEYLLCMQDAGWQSVNDWRLGKSE